MRPETYAMGRRDKELGLYPKSNRRALSNSKQRNLKFVFWKKNHSACCVENELEKAKMEAGRIGGKLKRGLAAWCVAVAEEVERNG